MSDSGTSGKKPIEEVQALRARKPKLERVSRDVTDRRKVEEALRESEASYRELADSITDIFFAMDKDLRYTYWNKASEKLTGISAKDAVGKPIFEIFPDTEDTKRAVAVYREVLRTQQAQSFVNEYQLNGKDFFFEINAYPSKQGLSVFVKDITERKKVEEELKRSKEYLNNIINALDDPVFVKDEQHRWVVLNDAACEVMGRSREELIGKSDYDLFPKEQTDVFWERDNFVLKSGRTDVNEEEITWHGKLHTISTKKSPLTDSLTGKKFIAGTIRDVTERKRWEEKLLEYQEQLRLMASELSLAEERERRRIATELHDRIGQDLVLSILKLDNLRKSVSSGALAAPLGEISNLLEKAIQDTRSLTLDLSSPMLYRFGFERTIADWLVQEVQKRHGIKSEFEDDGRPKPLEEDICVLLFQATRELLINVVKHAQAHVVKVSIRRKGGEIETIVEDDGIGLDLSEIESVMPSRGKFGLFSIRERLNYLGGNINIESEPGHGTRVILTAPLKGEKEATGED